MFFTLIFAASVTPAQAATAQIDLQEDRTITASGVVRKREYNIPNTWSEDADPSGAILISGDNITVDFNGATLRGTGPYTDPDARTGCGIEVRGKNVTIKNANVRGYKLGLYAEDAPGLKIVDSDFSYNWKQRLKSTPEREDLSDWTSYHENEKGEWLRFGAAIYLRKCDGFEVKGVTVRNGQNGLMMTECNRGLVWNNDFSFNSSLGIGMYRSSENRIMHNKIDWNVRGFSYGVYNRGQDSAGILIYEQSNKNVFAYNSVTHGGDGFFLWAGQTTMDTGKGGCNDNVVYVNDFSHAPTNGIEATFSRNTFANNLILECWHGIWGGYSYESKVIGNVFGYNAEGIAWEHGQDNLVEGNTFHRDHEGLVIWSNPTQDPNWEYPKRRDTKSRDWTIKNNTFGNTFLNALRIRRTEGVTLRQNQYWGVANVLKAEDVSRLTQEGEQENAMPALPPASALNQGDVVNVEDYERRFTGLAADWNPLARNTGTGEREKLSSSLRPKPLEGGMAPFLKPETLRGWRYMIVDEWGPYDFKRPILVPRGEVKPTAAEAGRVPPNARATVRRFEILGPKGTWRVVQKRGIETLSSESGDVPGFIDVTLPPGKASDVNLELEYRGDRVVDDRGVATGKGMPHRFGYTKFFAPIDWRVRFHAWNPERVKDPKAAMPTPGELLSKAELDKPLHELRTDRVDFGWGGSPATGVPADHFITIAEGELEIQQGEYTLNVTTDDGMRVWIDDVMVLESWKYQGPTPYSVNVRLQGKHRIRVEHYEIDGYAALKVELVPRKPIRS